MITRRQPGRQHGPAALALLLGLSLTLTACDRETPTVISDGAAPAQTDANDGAALPDPVVEGRLFTLSDDSGKALAGAMLSFQLDTLRRVTRFTNADGQIDLNDLSGDLSAVELRYPGLSGQIVDLTPGAMNISLSEDPDFLSTLPSSEWLALLPEGDRKREFTVNCGTCHEIGHDRIMLEGRPRTAEEWYAAFTMMRAMDAYEVIPPDFDDQRYSAWLAENLNAENIATLRPAAPKRADALARLEITEYTLPQEDSLPHDLVIGPDGRIWITAFLYDELWALSPDSGDIQRYSVDTRDDVNAQPRALKFDDSGMLWLVNGGTESVLRIDPATGDYEEIPVGMYAHSIDIDTDGDIWVNDYFATQERVARVSTGDSSVTVFPVPPANRPASEGLPLPYGLQVDARGRLYSTQLAANTLVRLNTASGEGTLFEMPMANSGPRRPGLDNQQGLWIPEFNTGHVAFFDPDTETFERVALGSSSIGLYDVEVNQANNDIWATGSLASTLIRYRADSGDILTVPLPTEPAYTRHIAVDETSGDVWTAYSSLPAALPRVARLRFLE